MRAENCKTLLCWCGIFPVFSGLFPHTNRIGCGGNENGPIPTGKYWIVDRPRGGVRSRLKEYEKHIRTGNDYSSWFALYRQDGLIDDSTEKSARLCAKVSVCIHCVRMVLAYQMGV
ncbi:DUF2778 domain-containing protein [Rahnella perminowiae]|uniref:DUF2778 domain-containing protein n=1 Tax=Rahnella perminowiae TaxID=2816244 RepID=UPI00215D5BF7|nr:DUF2778 domain-containing protein [Rahnella perminowiae]MCR9003713.1 DUF2778 domain-containing protein [Rahnella perminowiae]